ncbi:MAG: MBL fold metallo-hydrolase, partial [Chloroflexi bacterium]|nr:MBL fold metallo-hydrolase [Chloroflexota bacterium]
MANPTLTVGKVTVTAVKDLPAMRGDPHFMYPRAGTGEWGPHQHWLNERGHLDISIGSFLVRSAGKTILIDTGIGRRPRPGFRTDAADLLGNLAALGVQPGDVDMVVITHLHVDHVGWNTLPDGEGRTPSFPNARYLIQQAEWDYFMAPERREHEDHIMECVAPLEGTGLVDLTDHERAITPELSYLST